MRYNFEKTTKFLVLFLIILFLGVEAEAVARSKAVQKKINKAISKVWPKTDISYEKIDVDSSILIKYGIKTAEVYRLVLEDKLQGYMCITSAKGRFDYFDYLVIYSTDMAIRRIDVLVYPSSYGGEIMAQSWLKQFYNKKGGKEMEFGKDIDSISGASISAPSITNGLKNISLLMLELKQANKL